jgi:cobalt-zinc-cadmium efflux system protein
VPSYPLEVTTSVDRRLQWALVANSAIVVGQVGFGIAAHSLGLLADAGHNLVDVAGVVLALIGVRMARRPPDARRSFGYHRSPVLAAQANAGLILMVTGILGYEAVRRMIHPDAVHASVVIVVAAAAAVVNALAAVALLRHGGDVNLRAAMLHLVGDVAVSVGVVAAGIVMAIVGGAYWLDPLVSLLIGVVIAWQAVSLLRETADVLLESTPVALSTDELGAAIAAVPGVDDVHDLHVWTLGHQLHALSAHLVLAGHPDLEAAQATVNVVRRHVVDRFGIAHVTLEAECETCIDPATPDPCAMSDVVAVPVDVHAGHNHAGPNHAGPNHAGPDHHH